MALTKADKEWFIDQMKPIRQTLYGENGDEGLVNRVEKCECFERTLVTHSAYWKIAAFANGAVFIAVVGIIVKMIMKG